MKINKISVLIFGFTLFFCSCRRSHETYPQHKDLVDVVFASGSIVMEKNYLITAQTEGILSESYVTAGDSVKSGELLFRIDNQPQEAMVASSRAGYKYAENNIDKSSPVLQKLQLQYNQLADQLVNDSIQYMRYKTLYATRAVSRAEFDKMELTYKKSKSDIRQLGNTIADTRQTLQLEALNAKAGYLTQQNIDNQYLLKARYAGIVLNLPKIPGELIKRGETVAQIGAGKYTARLLVSEADIDKIRVGQEVLIELNTDKKNAHKAIITKVYPAFDQNEQSFMADAEFTQLFSGIRVGTQLQANIIVGKTENALVIPSAYLSDSNTVILAKTKAAVHVKTGIVTPEWAEITLGLHENDQLMLEKNGTKTKK